MDSSLEDIASKPGVPELIRALLDIAEKIERRPRLVGAIANPATTHDTFYSLLFGEVDDVLYRLKELEAAIANAGNSTSKNIAFQTEKMQKATAELIKSLQDLINQSGSAANAKMKEAREQQEIELKKSVVNAINAAIGAAVNAGVGRLGEALNTLEVAAIKAEKKVAAAAEASRPGWSALIAGVAGIAALVGGVGGFLASRVF